MTIQRLTGQDLLALHTYLESLSADSCKRFGPHDFDLSSLERLFHGGDHLGYLIKEGDNIMAYTVVKKGFLEHDRPRLQEYGFSPDHEKDATIAPSVGDRFQGRGRGRKLMAFVMEDLRLKGFHRVILWGGVQATNEKAIKMYRTLGFRLLGSFEYHGENHDMVRDLK